jgi:hypothetical protein
MANVERRLADNFWDLRDDAYDHPARWKGVTAETVFQRLAEYVEEAEERGEPIELAARRNKPHDRLASKRG